ncbi:hypothetical protein C8D93_1302 [Sinimarinibacterium flocculans]|uniref:Uncharacterized protein n=1 Tax=Sinimarinibacterium flocculans TaxID=985250 RepID=A0A318E4H0_9GAMM|nr:hypothetical protein C8D93_1302 [Sinimarinibacterium flocculans]
MAPNQFRDVPLMDVLRSTQAGLPAASGPQRDGCGPIVAGDDWLRGYRVTMSSVKGASALMSWLQAW